MKHAVPSPVPRSSQVQGLRIFMFKFYVSLFANLMTHLSYDVPPGNDIMPFIKIDKPLGYHYVMTYITCIYGKFSVFFKQKYNLKVILGSYDK